MYFKGNGALHLNGGNMFFSAFVEKFIFSYECPFFSATVRARCLKFCTIIPDIELPVFTYKYDITTHNVNVPAIFCWKK